MHTCMYGYPKRSEEDTGTPGSGVTDFVLVAEPGGSSARQPVLLTNESLLQPLHKINK